VWLGDVVDAAVIFAVVLANAVSGFVALTGESLPVAKHPLELPSPTLLADRSNMAWTGTFVTSGRGRGVVVAHAGDTELGRVHRLMGSADDLVTPLTRELTRFSRLLTVVILGLAVAAFVLGVVRGEPVGDMVTAAVALAVATIPSWRTSSSTSCACSTGAGSVGGHGKPGIASPRLGGGWEMVAPPAPESPQPPHQVQGLPGVAVDRRLRERHALAVVDRVGAVTAAAVVLVSTGREGRLEIGVHVRGVVTVDDVVAALPVDVVAPEIAEERVAAWAAENVVAQGTAEGGVGTVARRDRVYAAEADDRVVARAGGERVVPAETGERVVAQAADQRVVVGTVGLREGRRVVRADPVADQDVMAQAAIDDVVSGIRTDDVVPTSGVDHVGLVTADDYVVTSRTRDYAGADNRRRHLLPRRATERHLLLGLSRPGKLQEHQC
jgi:E1-E2 ATPase